MLPTGSIAVTAAVLMLAQGSQALREQDCPIFGVSNLVREWVYSPPETESGADQIIGRLQWAAFSDNGRAYVLDSMRSRVVVLDAHGKYLRGFGQRGQGPGDFSSPVSVRGIRGGGFAVMDGGLSRVSYFSSGGDLLRTVRLSPVVSRVRDFVILPDGGFALSGFVGGSGGIVHVYDARGQYLKGYGQPRNDLMEPTLRERYSGGLLAVLEDSAIAFAQRTPFRYEVFRSGETLTDRTDENIVPDYVADTAIRLEDNSGWKFLWRHPSLTTLIPIGGCVLVAVHVPPSQDAEVVDFETTLSFLDASNGQLLETVNLETFLWPLDIREDSAGTHLLVAEIDRVTANMSPAQYAIQR